MNVSLSLIDWTKFYIPSNQNPEPGICDNGHEFEGTGCHLVYTESGLCVRCVLERDRRARQRKREPNELIRADLIRTPTFLPFDSVSFLAANKGLYSRHVQIVQFVLQNPGCTRTDISRALLCTEIHVSALCSDLKSAGYLGRIRAVGNVNSVFLTNEIKKFLVH